MAKSLLEQLPGVVAEGKNQAAQILDQLGGQNGVSLQARELAIPAKDRVGFSRRVKNAREGTEAAPNCLIHGDNFLDYARLRRSSTARQKKLQ